MAPPAPGLAPRPDSALPANVAARVADGWRQFQDAICASMKRRFEDGRQTTTTITGVDIKEVIAEAMGNLEK